MPLSYTDNIIIGKDSIIQDQITGQELLINYYLKLSDYL